MNKLFFCRALLMALLLAPRGPSMAQWWRPPEGATNIAAGSANEYIRAARTLTWNTNGCAPAAHSHFTNAFAPVALAVDDGGTALVERANANWFYLACTQDTTLCVAPAWSLHEGGSFRLDLDARSHSIAFPTNIFRATGPWGVTNILPQISTAAVTKLLFDKAAGDELWTVHLLATGD